jgi:hypothetical protein
MSREIRKFIDSDEIKKVIEELKQEYWANLEAEKAKKEEEQKIRELEELKIREEAKIAKQLKEIEERYNLMLHYFEQLPDLFAKNKIVDYDNILIKSFIVGTEFLKDKNRIQRFNWLSTTVREANVNVTNSMYGYEFTSLEKFVEFIGTFYKKYKIKDAMSLLNLCYNLSSQNIKRDIGRVETEVPEIVNYYTYK